MPHRSGPWTLVAILAAVTAVTSAINCAAVLRFRDVAQVARAIGLEAAAWSYDDQRCLLTMTMQIANRSRRECRIQYIRLTVTSGDRFIGTLVAGHGPRLDEGTGPEFVGPGAITPLVLHLPLSGIHLSHFLEDGGATLRATGVMTIAVVSLGAEIDRQVGVRF